MQSGSRIHLQKNTPLLQSTINNVRNLKNHLQEYQRVSRRPIEFDNIDMTFYYGFTDYITKVKMANINTIGKLITNIKVVIREAFEFGYSSNMIFTHRKFRSAAADTDMVYLSNKEIGKLDLSEDKCHERVRDLFLVGCYTGLRYFDLSKLSADAIDGDILCVTQVKTGDPVDFPLSMEVKAILDKYNGQFHESISNQELNKYLGEVCAKCELLQKEVCIQTFTAGKRMSIVKPKHEFVTSHTAHRSFATKEYLARDLQPAEIRSITGHKTDKSFYKYIRTTPRENAENVAKKWKEREDQQLRIANPKGQPQAV